MVESAGSHHLQSCRCLALDHIGSRAVVLTLCSPLKLLIDYLPSGNLLVALLCSPPSLLEGRTHLSSLWVPEALRFVGFPHIKLMWIRRYHFLSDIPIRSSLTDRGRYMHFPLLVFPIDVAYYLRLVAQVSPLWSLSTALSSVVPLAEAVLLYSAASGAHVLDFVLEHAQLPALLSLLFGFFCQILFFSRTIAPGLSASQRTEHRSICTHC